MDMAISCLLAPETMSPIRRVFGGQPTVLLHIQRIVLIVSWGCFSVTLLLLFCLQNFSTNDPSFPLGLNIGGTEARCGKTDSRNYDYPKNALGGDLAPDIQACYAEGDVIELDVVLTAHHMGHFTYKACAINAGEVASQECFDSNPLTFVEDVLYGSLPDPDNADRVYIPRSDAAFIQKDNGHYKFSHRFRLPEGLSGDLVLLQWYYITANSCLADEGYLNYSFPAGFEPNLQVGVCNSIPPDGRGVPEQVSELINWSVHVFFGYISCTVSKRPY